MPENFKSLLEHIPFIFLTVIGGKTQVVIDWRQLLQAVVISCVVGGFGGFIVLKQLEVKMTQIDEAMKRVECRIDTIDKRVYDYAIARGANR